MNYTVINDGAGAKADTIRYVLIDDQFNRNETVQNLAQVNHHKG